MTQGLANFYPGVAWKKTVCFRNIANDPRFTVEVQKLEQQQQ